MQRLIKAFRRVVWHSLASGCCVGRDTFPQHEYELIGTFDDVSSEGDADSFGWNACRLLYDGSQRLVE